LGHCRPARKAGKENAFRIGVFAAKNFIKNAQQISFVIDGQHPVRKKMCARTLHLPKGYVIVPVQRLVMGLIGVCRNRIGKHNQKSVTIRFTDPIKIFRGGFRRASNAAEHKDSGRMSCQVRGAINQIRTAVSVMDERPSLDLRETLPGSRHRYGG
jgi:hypothetical protein